MVKVIFINREFRKTAFSIEGIFDVVKSFLKGRIKMSDFNLDPSKSRVGNIFAVKKLQADIFHITGDVYFLAMGLNGKVILTLHDLGHYKTLRKNPLKFFVYKYAWLYFPFKKADTITVVSEDTGNELIHFFPFTRDKIKIVYNPVKPVFKYQRKEELNKKPRILQIGTGAHKNLDNLVEACRGLDVHLDIIAWVDDALVTKMQKYRISYSIYNGLSDEQVNERYTQADILFFASFQEGFGMPIIEAQSVGRPVITSAHGAMKEVAKDTAILVDPRNVEQIKDAIQKLITDKDLYEEIVRKGLDNSRRFTPEKIANDYLLLYNSIHASR